MGSVSSRIAQKNTKMKAFVLVAVAVSAEAQPEADAYRVYGNLVHPIHSTYTGHSVYPGYTGYAGFKGYTGLPLSSTYRSPVFHGIGKREADPEADAYRVYGNFAYSGFPAYSGFNRFNGYRGYNGYYY